MRLLPGRSESAWGCAWLHHGAQRGQRMAPRLVQSYLQCAQVTKPGCAVDAGGLLPDQSPSTPLSLVLPLPFCLSAPLVLSFSSALPISSSILLPLIYSCPSFLSAPSFFLSPSGSFPLPLEGLGNLQYQVFSAFLGFFQTV